MSTLQPVAELVATSASSWWPVTPGAPWRVVALDGRIPPDEIGALIWQVAMGCLPESADGCGEDVSAAEAVRGIIAAEALAICGGLRAENGAGAVIDPGCCSDLEEWREWARFAERPALWLGHDPSPWVEYRDSCLRLHPDGGMQPRPMSGQTGFVEFSHDELSDVLRTVRRDLLGFLDALSLWARRIVPEQAAELVDVFDVHFQISQPL
ncbi:MAG TPA: hypothetical protein VL551_18590 [Actinospica sp.]|nr:hypothetical protein [Actinospica sp.]